MDVSQGRQLRATKGEVCPVQTTEGGGHIDILMLLALPQQDELCLARFQAASIACPGREVRDGQPLSLSGLAWLGRTASSCHSVLPCGERSKPGRPARRCKILGFVCFTTDFLDGLLLALRCGGPWPRRNGQMDAPIHLALRIRPLGTLPCLDSRVVSAASERSPEPSLGINPPLFDFRGGLFGQSPEGGFCQHIRRGTLPGLPDNGSWSLYRSSAEVS